MKYRDITVVRDGVKVTLCAPRPARKTEKTWATATGHTFNYVGLGGRGSAKGRSTKTFQI